MSPDLTSWPVDLRRLRSEAPASSRRRRAYIVALEAQVSGLTAEVRRLRADSSGERRYTIDEVATGGGPCPVT